jgi:hypothetical protein
VTIHETRTDLEPAEVLARARSFFPLAGTPYAAFPESEGDGFLRLRMEVGEMVIAAGTRDGTTWVRGSASRGIPLLTHFLTTLGPLLDTKETVNRHSGITVHEALVESYTAPREPQPPAEVPLAWDAVVASVGLARSAAAPTTPACSVAPPVAAR